MKAKLLTIPELAIYFNVPRHRIYDLLRRGCPLPRFKIGYRWRIDMDKLRDWLCDEIENPNRKGNGTDAGGDSRKPGISSGWRNRRKQNRPIDPVLRRRQSLD